MQWRKNTSKQWSKNNFSPSFWISLTRFLMGWRPVLSQSVYQALGSTTAALTSGVFQIINVRQDSAVISPGNASIGWRTNQIGQTLPTCALQPSVGHVQQEMQQRKERCCCCGLPHCQESKEEAELLVVLSNLLHLNLEREMPKSPG